MLYYNRKKKTETLKSKNKEVNIKQSNDISINKIMDGCDHNSMNKLKEKNNHK